MTKTERIILFLLAALNFTHILDFMIMMPLSNYLMPYFHIGAQQFSILVASYSISACISGLVVAMVIDRFDRKKALIVAYIGFILGTLACGVAPSYGLLLTARILAGLFGGILGAQALAIVADLFTYERRGRAMGAVMSAFAAASILGVPISLYLTNLFKFNWHVPFLVIGGLGTVLIPFMIIYLPSMVAHIREGEQKIRFDAIRTVVENKSQRTALIFSCLLMMGHFLIIPFINPYLEFNKGFSKGNIPLIYLSGGIASFVAAIFLGRYSDKVGKLPVFLWSVFFSLFMVLIITAMPNVHFSIILGFFALWFMLATGRAVTAQAMISEVVSSEQRGSFMSVNGSVQQLGSGIASLAAGAIVFTDKASGKIMHYNWVGYLSIAVLFTTMVLGRFIFKKVDKN
ncbi:MAG: MFS transporter [Chitinophagaceae bacterium]|nr:MFS transporter [Chitinophagaceae bacterium]